MAARSVHVYFKNLTDETLVRDSEGLDHGIYTEPWFPPKSISPFAVGEWITESDGFATGTEGHAKYVISAGQSFEFVEVTWDNPFIGRNSSSINIVADFSGEKSKVFEGANTINGEPPPNWVKMRDGDVEAWIDAVLFPPYVFANASSANDANATFAIRRKGVVTSPLFGAPSDAPISLKVNTALKAAEWAGLWVGDGVSVTLAALTGRNMAANILDTTASLELNFQENFTLGGKAWMMNALVAGISSQFGVANLSANAGTVSAVTVAAAKSVSSLHEVAHADAVSIVQNAIRVAVDAQGGRLSEASLVSVSKSTVAVANLSTETTMLSHGIGLTLYDDFQDGKKVGGRLLYERVNIGEGKRLTSRWLSFHPTLN